MNRIFTTVLLVNRNSKGKFKFKVLDNFIFRTKNAICSYFKHILKLEFE